MPAAGAYVLVLELPRAQRIAVGRLGTFDFAAGQYAYVGSAMNSLEGRIRRYLAARKRLRWHIDYLLERAQVKMVLAIPGERALECAVSGRLAEGAGSSRPIAGFGSSDCRCRSHLHYWPLPVDGGRLVEIALQDVVEAG